MWHVVTASQSVVVPVVVSAEEGSKPVAPSACLLSDRVGAPIPALVVCDSAAGFNQ